MVLSDNNESVNKLLVEKTNLINQFNQILSVSQESQNVEKECQELLQQVNEATQSNETIQTTLKSNLAINENLKAKLAKLRGETEVAQFKCTELANSLEVRENDKLRLEKSKEMLEVGKEFTGIRWDYSAPDNVAKGYIANKSKKILEPITIDKSETSEEKIQINLWNKIQATSSVDWSDLTAKMDQDQRIMNKENNTQKNCNRIFTTSSK